ncbi:hypothetical protein F751_3023 [Auxenochlorella protothecoides]|uniref:Uncharacterized protein n=1 Tax=Auxenochlorella protothecoides TaxID=3075 RepID=A0A087SI60_AUXPR|nr:hypothetical protein F751_3023 [Auxenochlorella protothecoides]KFM25414.1 hypothetical protein F751_3023 [Auxenochlorella protothecoides]
MGLRLGLGDLVTRHRWSGGPMVFLPSIARGRRGRRLLQFYVGFPGDAYSTLLPPFLQHLLPGPDRSLRSGALGTLHRWNGHRRRIAVIPGPG